MKHRAVFWIGGKVHCIIETKTSRQLAINIRNQIVQLTMENEHAYSIEVNQVSELVSDTWKHIL